MGRGERRADGETLKKEGREGGRHLKRRRRKRPRERRIEIGGQVT